MDVDKVLAMLDNMHIDGNTAMDMESASPMSDTETMDLALDASDGESVAMQDDDKLAQRVGIPKDPPTAFNSMVPTSPIMMKPSTPLPVLYSGGQPLFCPSLSKSVDQMDEELAMEFDGLPDSASRYEEKLHHEDEKIDAEINCTTAESTEQPSMPSLDWTVSTSHKILEKNKSHSSAVCDADSCSKGLDSASCGLLPSDCDLKAAALRLRLEDMKTESDKHGSLSSSPSSMDCTNEYVEVQFSCSNDGSLFLSMSDASSAGDKANLSAATSFTNHPSPSQSTPPDKSIVTATTENQRIKPGCEGYVRQQTLLLERQSSEKYTKEEEEVKAEPPSSNVTTEDVPLPTKTYAQVVRTPRNEPTQGNGLDDIKSDVEALKIVLLTQRNKRHGGARTNILPRNFHNASSGSVGKSNKINSSPENPHCQAEIDICLVVDCSLTMAKFFAPLRSSLVLFWKMVSSSEENRVRISCATSCGFLHLTSNESSFVAFIESIETNEPSDKNQDLFSGFTKSISFLREVKWRREARHFVFLLTNLAHGESDDGDDNDDNDESYNAWEQIDKLRSHVRQIPWSAHVCVGTWLNDNNLLPKALQLNGSLFQTFPLLSAWKMAELVINDVDLIRAVRASLSVSPKVEGRVKISDEKPSEKCLRKRSKIPSFKVSGNVILVDRPIFKSIRDIQAPFNEPDGRSCSLRRDATPSGTTSHTALYKGTLPTKKGYGEVVFECSILDAWRNCSEPKARMRCLGRLWFSAVASFLADEYNNKHRPEHCLRIHFLRSFVVHESFGEKRRTFYVEQKPPRDVQTFCSPSGEWNEALANETLLRFAQSTFKLSGGELIVAGLKGIKCRDTFLLTGPVVLSRNTGTEIERECTKEYLIRCRKEAKKIMENRGWKKERDASLKEKSPKRCRLLGFL